MTKLQENPMGWIPVSLLIAANLAAGDATPAPPQAGTPPAVLASPLLGGPPGTATGGPVVLEEGCGPWWADSDRQPFESDQAFPRFIGPISNAILTKDP